MASIRDTLTKLLASDKPEPGTPLANYVGQYPFQQGEAPLEAPMLSPDDLIGTGIGKAIVAGGAAKLAPLLASHIAYHGSPHVFDKFLLEKVGTGEGAQMYGHGMYFAENPKTAEQYLKDLGTEITVNNKPIFKANKVVGTTGNESIDDYLLMHHGDTNKALASVKNDYNLVARTNPEGAKSYLSEINALENLQKSNAVKVHNTGNIYKVDIPDEHIPKMLDWHKPLLEQTPEVKQALSNLPHRSPDWTFKNSLETMQAAPHTKDVVGMNPTGQEIYSLLGEGMMVGNKAPGQKYASDLLSKQGITGIKYLDSGSRAAGGTHNLVVFDPSTTKILDRKQQLIDLLQQ